jgi:putative transposase
MLGFKNFDSASRTLTGIEMVSMIKKEQITCSTENNYNTFCSLAA